jgi:hypothetical protein
MMLSQNGHSFTPQSQLARVGLANRAIASRDRRLDTRRRGTLPTSSARYSEEGKRGTNTLGNSAP